MNIGNEISICRKNSRQPWKWFPFRLTLKQNPPIFVWLWWSFMFGSGNPKENRWVKKYYV